MNIYSISNLGLNNLYEETHSYEETYIFFILKILHSCLCMLNTTDVLTVL